MSVWDSIRAASAWKKVAMGVHVLCVILLVLYVVLAPASNTVSQVWIVSWGIAAGLLVFAPWFPIFCLASYVFVAYGSPRYGPEYDALLSTRILDLVTLVSLIGWIIGKGSSRVQSILVSPLSILMFSLMAWIALAIVGAWLQGYPWSPNPRHHPLLFWQSLAMFLLAALVLETRATTWQFALVVCGVLCMRAFLQGESGVYLENDVALLLVIAVPLVLLGIWIAPNVSIRLALGLLAVYMLYSIALTHNRGAAVALAVAILVIVWQSRYRWRLLGIGVPVLFVTMITLMPGAYRDRFRALWDEGAAHSTAGLDRATASERLLLWDAGWRMSKDKPIIGIGPGNYPNMVKLYAPGKDSMSAHNNYLHMAAETGLVGLALYLLVFASALFSLGRVLRWEANNWRAVTANMLIASIAAYMVGGIFTSRHDLVLAYVLVGWALAVSTPTAIGIPGKKPPSHISEPTSRRF